MNHFFFRKLFVGLVFGVTLVVTPIHSARADIWGAAYAAQAWKWMQENIGRQIEGMVTGALKTAVIQVMNMQITLAVGGNGQSGPMFIVNWQQFLYTQPEQKARAELNKFFTATTGGRASSNYKTVAQLDPSQVSGSQGRAQAYARKQWLAQEGVVAGVGNFGGGSAGNYYAQLKDVAQKSLSAQIPKMDLYEYVSSPQQAFQQWRGFNAYFSNCSNNPMCYSMMAQQAYSRELQQQQMISFAMSIAGGGYLPKMQNGQVVTPGKTIGDLVANAEDVWNKMIAATDNPSALSSTVTSLANMATQKLVQTGIGMAQQYVQGQINQGMSYVQGQVNGQLGRVGVSASFGVAGTVGGASVPANVSGVTQSRSSSVPLGTDIKWESEKKTSAVPLGTDIKWQSETKKP